MTENIDDLRAAGENCPFFSTDAANILALTDHLSREYGGAAGFLAQCGVGKDVLDALYGRLVKKA